MATLTAISAPRSRQRPRASTRSLLISRESLIIFTSALACYLAIAVYFGHLDLFFRDAVSRTSQAYFVLFSHDPHLGAIGFVWNPLPALLQIPIVALQYWRNGNILLSGGILTAICGASTVLVLNHLFEYAGIPPTLRRVLVLLYVLNPMVLLYSTNGMSEAPFILAIVVAIFLFWHWADTGSLGSFFGLALTSGLMLQIRYEALAFIAAMVIAVAAVLIARSWSVGKKQARERAEGHAIAYALPAAYSFALWLFLNWAIMGDPLYFLRSVYGNSAQTQMFRTGDVVYLDPVVGSIWGSLGYSARLGSWLFPVFGIILLSTLFLAVKQRHIFTLSLILLALAIPGFELVMLYRGQSFGWLRFFIYAIPFSFILLAALWRLSPRLRSFGQHRAGLALLVMLLLGANVSSWVAMDSQAMGIEEKFYTCKVLDPSRSSTYHSIDQWRLLSDYITFLTPSGLVLLDVFTGYPLPMVGNSGQYLITSDFDFEAAVGDPDSHVSYVLVPAPVGLGAYDRINREYPALWENGNPGFTLVARFTNNSPDEDRLWAWSLYAVGDTRPQRAAAPTIFFNAPEECDLGSGIGNRVINTVERFPWLGP